MVKLEVEAVADAENPAIVPRAREAADSVKIEAFIDEYRKTGSQGAIASAEVLATTAQQKEMIAKAHSVPVATASAPAAAPAARAPSVDVTRFDKSLELVAKCDKACRDERRARK